MLVITGATKGIGKAIAARFAQAGMPIAACARSRADLDTLKKELEKDFQVEVFTCQTDLSRKEEVLRFADFVLKTGKKIKVLVNNAGKFVQGSMQTEADGLLEEMLNVNLLSAYHLSRALFPTLLKEKKGHIFNICSIASIKAFDNCASYNISKFALLGMTKAMREELKTQGIKVTAVMPGATLTDAWAGSDIDPDRIIDPKDVAEAVFAAYQLSDRAVVEELLIRPQLGDL
jgi:short-subunit dehydrogenase